jgi:proteasome alpha subunit
MSIGFGYVTPEQIIKDKADLARKGIARGRPLVVLEYADGILFVADNPSTHLHKVGELYDRIAFAAVGRFSEFESLRVAGVRLADLRGYSYGREDVSSRSIANAYSQTLGQIFIQEPKPYEIELCVAEVGTDGSPSALYHIIYDGTVTDRKGYLAIGGQSEQLDAALRGGYGEGMELDAALSLAVQVLRGAEPGGDNTSRLEVAVLERGAARRAFRRLSQDDVAARTSRAGPKDEGAT